MSRAYLGNQYITYTQLGTNFGIPQHEYYELLNIDYLVVAGGGGGCDGGGGAGGLVSGSGFIRTAIYNIIVGAGGNGSPSIPTNGNNSSIAFLSQSIAYGGGFGGGGSVVPNGGGSGGGGGYAQITGGSGISGQGFKGGNVAGFQKGGGGGGASQTGSYANSSNPLEAGNGGSGSLWLDGNFYAGGGAGGVFIGSPGPQIGGVGGGGNGANDAFAAVAGTVNTGGGGGGWYSNGPGGPANGGSGIVKIRYAGTPVATGGTITQSGGYTYHAFTNVGTSSFTFTSL